MTNRKFGRLRLRGRYNFAELAAEITRTDSHHAECGKGLSPALLSFTLARQRTLFLFVLRTFSGSFVLFFLYLSNNFDMMCS